MKFYHLLWLCLFSARGDNWRKDASGEIKAKEGTWAATKWASPIYCKPGKYAIGIALKVWKNTDDLGLYVDDVGATTMRLLCSDYEELITANDHVASWGSWSKVYCPTGSYIIGFKTKVSSNQGGGGGGGADDISFVSVRGECSDNARTMIEPSNGASFVLPLGVDADWGEFATKFAECPARSAVCGFAQSIWPSCGSDCDDTALEAVRLNCCTNTKILSKPRGFWTRLLGIGGGGSGTFSKTVGVSKHEESELTTEFSASVTASVSSEFVFGSVTVEASLSTGIAERTLSSTSLSYESSISVTCPAGKDAMYQWKYSLNEDCLTETFVFDIGTLDTWCVSKATMVPKCPFMYCEDTDCQQCSPAFDVSKMQKADDTIFKEFPVGIDDNDYVGYGTYSYVHIALALAIVFLLLCIVVVLRKVAKSTQKYQKVLSDEDNI